MRVAMRTPYRRSVVMMQAEKAQQLAEVIRASL